MRTALCSQQLSDPGPIPVTSLRNRIHFRASIPASPVPGSQAHRHGTHYYDIDFHDMGPRQLKEMARLRRCAGKVARMSTTSANSSARRGSA
jgi:hypothetical protein